MYMGTCEKLRRREPPVGDGGEDIITERGVME